MLFSMPATLLLGFTTTKVFRKKLNQLSLFCASASDSLIGNNTSKRIEEFCGLLLATAVTLCGVNAESSFSIIIFPTTSLLPKCFMASSSEITTDPGSFKQVFASPYSNGKLKTEKKVESTYNNSWLLTSVP